MGRQFIIRTDHKSLKELLTQVIQTSEHQYFLRKLIGYQFVIEYKPSSENSAVDSLPWIHEETVLEDHHHLYTAVSSPSFAFMDILLHENQSLTDLLDLHNQLQGETEGSPKYSCRNGYLLY